MDGRQLQSIAEWSRAYALSASVGGSWFTDVGVAALGNVPTLNLSHTKVTDVGVAALGNVHTLDLTGANVTDRGVWPLRNVHKLDLSGTKVTKYGVATLGNVRDLSTSCKRGWDLHNQAARKCLQNTKKGRDAYDDSDPERGGGFEYYDSYSDNDAF